MRSTPVLRANGNGRFARDLEKPSLLTEATIPTLQILCKFETARFDYACDEVQSGTSLYQGGRRMRTITGWITGFHPSFLETGQGASNRNPPGRGALSIRLNEKVLRRLQPRPQPSLLETSPPSTVRGHPGRNRSDLAAQTSRSPSLARRSQPSLSPNAPSARREPEPFRRRWPGGGPARRGRR